MGTFQQRRPVRICVAVITVVLSVGTTVAVGACVKHRSARAADPSPSFRLMPDGKQWLSENLSIEVPGSSCYQGEARMCRQYGRLYTWAAARAACRALGSGSRLPTEDEWRLLAKAYGGLYGESADSGKLAYQSLTAGGRSGFNALFGGGAEPGNGAYSRLEAHGFYWTSSQSGSAGATFINFARASQALYRQPDGEKERAFSVRCVRDSS